jgi:hypothetical protein
MTPAGGAGRASLPARRQDVAGSILYPPEASRAAAGLAGAPACFADLNLDRILAALTASREAYALDAYFCAPPGSLDVIRWRHDVLREFEHEDVAGPLRQFSQQMRIVRQYIEHAEKLHWPRQRERWYLDALALYGRALRTLTVALDGATPRAHGLRALGDFLTACTGAAPFRARAEEAERLLAALREVQTSVCIKGDQVTVRAYVEAADLGAEVEAACARFGHGKAKEPRFALRDEPEMNHIEAKILDLIAELYPDLFAAVSAFVATNVPFLDAEVLEFDREIQFCLAYKDYMERFQSAGLPFCYPRLTTDAGAVDVEQGYELALAGSMLAAGESPVCNDFRLHGEERMLVVSGPNQGGKTTFSRLVGQIHYLASIGLPVPAARAQLFFCDQVFTHFERPESSADRRSKLQDDLLRVRSILDHATTRSIVILNEIFSSTPLADASFLSREIAQMLLARGVISVWVTFIEELSTLGPQTVSMVSGVAADDPTRRTFRIERRPADGLAHALALASKWRLTEEAIAERMQR